MIITRSPLRISLGGGGTDLASYYRGHEGFLIAGAIDKYVYITLHETFVEDCIIKYSKLERVSRIDDIQHPIIREALRLLNVPIRSLEISSLADIPAGTGLGSSGSFTTALLKTLHAFQKNLIHPRDLAEQACHIEIDLLKEPIGKQDQYIAAFGGVTCFTFRKDGYVESKPLNLSKSTLYEMEDGLLLFFTGFSRAASTILEEQDTKTRRNDREVTDNLNQVKQMGLESQRLLETGDLRGVAKLMNEHWERKKQRSKEMSNPQINEWYDLAMRNGALGGKLVGAGGGGFLMFYAEDTKRLRQAMESAGLSEVRFRFDFEGTRVVTQS
jgi:D-glycero-alpha-D-manno-heptose-7-phosphate kinase